MLKREIVLAWVGGAAAVGLLFFAGRGSPCTIARQESTVAGNSLAGLIGDSESVAVLEGYYRCREVRRGDIVAYQHTESGQPLVKIVKGVSGDRLALQESGGAWHILINRRTVVNAQGEPYRINGARAQMLSLYINDYSGRIPEGALLLLGNEVRGSFDSTQFGLVGVRELIGKVVLR